MKSNIIVFLVCIISLPALLSGQAPSIYSSDGEYLGSLSKNPYDPNSISNPYGIYGSKYSSKSINNPYGIYGSRYSSHSPNNPFGGEQAPRIYSGKEYLGRLSKNKYDAESVSNPSGTYGSPYSPKSINNRFGTYGSEYSSKSARNRYATSSEWITRQQNQNYNFNVQKNNAIAGYKTSSGWPNAGTIMRNDIITIQRLLKAEGLYGGAIDGIIGPKTLEAAQIYLKKTKNK